MEYKLNIEYSLPKIENKTSPEFEVGETNAITQIT